MIPLSGRSEACGQATAFECKIFKDTREERGEVMSDGVSTTRPLVLVLLAAFLLAALPGISHPFENSPSLPDIKGWSSGVITTTELESQGIWLERTYSRITDRHRILVIVLEGPGTSWSGLPEAPVSADDGLIGSGATYRTTTVAGFPAAIENHPLTGSSLTVTVAVDETFTFETAFDDVDLENFAGEFLKDII